MGASQYAWRPHTMKQLNGRKCSVLNGDQCYWTSCSLKDNRWFCCKFSQFLDLSPRVLALSRPLPGRNFCHSSRSSGGQIDLSRACTLNVSQESMSLKWRRKFLHCSTISVPECLIDTTCLIISAVLLLDFSSFCRGFSFLLRRFLRFRAKTKTTRLRESLVRAWKLKWYLVPVVVLTCGLIMRKVVLKLR